MEALIFDTTFLIDFQRERKLGGGEAHDFLRENAASPALLPVVAYGEFCEEFDDPWDPDFLSMVESFELVPLTSGWRSTTPPKLGGCGESASSSDQTTCGLLPRR